jgi:hypothetical protein
MVQDPTNGIKPPNCYTSKAFAIPAKHTPYLDMGQSPIHGLM